MTDPIKPAHISFSDNGTPVADDYDDVYFSQQSGLAETQYVFIDQNNLSKRFTALNQRSLAEQFIVAETGFGSGLNFCATASLFKQLVTPPHQLFYLAAEAHPLKKRDLDQILSHFPSVNKVHRSLVNHYPPLCQGIHCLKIDNNISLILIFDDATAGFKQMLASPDYAYFDNPANKVDAWFLDGFAPSKNPSLWHDELFSLVGRLSHHKTTLSTFTAAGKVKRGLIKQGFQVEKIKGFGHKREMIRATYQNPLPLKSPKIDLRQKTATEFWPIYHKNQPVKQVSIIGAGIAGVLTAKRLAEAGFQVQIIDQAKAPLSAASGNPQAILYPKFSAFSGTLADFYTAAYWFATRYYPQTFANAFHPTGLVQLLTTAKMQNEAKLCAQRYAEIEHIKWVDPQKITTLSGVKTPYPGLFFPQSGWIAPQEIALCLNHPNIKMSLSTEVTEIQPKGNQWLIKTANNTLETEAIILTSGHLSESLLQQLDANLCFKTKPIKGQITSIPADHLPSIKTVICHEGYIAPATGGYYHLGASYDFNSQDTELSLQAQQHNFNKLSQVLAQFDGAKIQHYKLAGKTGIRCTTRDYLPIVGPVPKSSAFIQDYSDLRKNKHFTIAKKSEYWPNLFINTGLGSRGFTSAPMNAEIIHAYMTHGLFPLTFRQVKALHPGRFIIREIIKNQFKSFASND